MNASVVDFNPSLRSAQQAFDRWRSERTQRESTPLALRRCAVALLEQHCAFHICRALRINSKALRQWSDEQRGISNPTTDEKSASFVRLPVNEPAQANPAPSVAGSLTIELPNATVVRVHHAFTLDEVFQAAARLGANTSSF